MTTLIANSGIQLIKTEFTSNPNEDAIRGIRFHEWTDTQRFEKRIEMAYYLADYDLVVSRRELFQAGFFVDGRLAEEVNTNVLKHLTPGKDTFSVNDISYALEYLIDKWVPIPFFKRNAAGNSIFGSINWCRMQLRIKDKVGEKINYEAVLAFDTNVNHKEENEESPFFEDDDSINFGLCGDTQQILDFCSDEKGCGWVRNFLCENYLVTNENKKDLFPIFRYVGDFVFLIKYLSFNNIFDDVKLYTDKDVEYSNVDLVLDMGNSKTCGLLFDSTENRDPFTQVKKLKIQDISNPFLSDSEPFSMRLAFHKANYGEMQIDSKQFVWPSIMRVGKEAERLIYNASSLSDNGKNKVNNHSSPKRYLWDDKPSKLQWEFIQLEGTNPINAIFLEGISQQFTKDGKLNTSTRAWGAESTYSRQSLMTFVFLEVLAHAHVQINSYEFRQEHGNFNTPRRLNKVVVTCPTAMSQKEQIILRKCAQDARIVLNRFYNNTYTEEYEEKAILKALEVIPSVKDLSCSNSELEDKKDWNYDEATCCQLVFVYAEISRRYLNRCDDYFDLYGKYRTDIPNYDKKSLTIGSLDIGGGTTDIMISTYKYGESNKAVLTPIPLFWESFNTAGDDLLKEIIKQVMIDGDVMNNDFQYCTGVIYNHLLTHIVNGDQQMALDKIDTFFGVDQNAINYFGKQRRREFNVQVAIPLANRYLELTQQKEERHYFGFADIFQSNTPNKAILDAFHNHFGFRFEDLKWSFDIKRINDIISLVFESLLKQLSSIFFTYGCDFVIIAGKPTSLHQVEDLFLKYFPVPPNRLISLNNYRVGKWYPFQNKGGYFEDQKSIVAVGAMIGLMGGRLDGLGDFRIDISYLKNKMPSTYKNFGVYNRYLRKIDDCFLTPDQNKTLFTVESLPLLLGSKQFDSPSYLGKPLYSLDFNESKLREKVLNKGITDLNEIHQEIESIKSNLVNKMPYQIRFQREYRENRENIEIDSIIDRDKNEISPTLISLNLQSIIDEKGYWLDTGEFINRL